MKFDRLRAYALKSAVVTVGTCVMFACTAEGDDLVGKTESSVVKGPDGGWIMEDAGYCCYDYVTNSCHHAANCGVDAGNDGVLSCTGATSGPYGHTVVWDRPDPTNPSLVCVANPQVAGSSACCWTDSNKSGTPSLSSSQAQSCIEKMCKTQYKPDAAVAMDGGWDVNYLDCAGTTLSRTSCETCCDNNANAIPSKWGDAAIEDRENYRTQCKQSCASK